MRMRVSKTRDRRESVAWISGLLLLAIVNCLPKDRAAFQPTMRSVATVSFRGDTDCLEAVRRILLEDSYQLIEEYAPEGPFGHQWYYRKAGPAGMTHVLLGWKSKGDDERVLEVQVVDTARVNGPEAPGLRQQSDDIATEVRKTVESNPCLGIANER